MPGDSIKKAGHLTTWVRGIRRSLSHLSSGRWVPLPEPFAEQVFSGGIFFEDFDSLHGIRRGQGESCQACKLLSGPISIPSAGLNQLQGGLMGSGEVMLGPQQLHPRFSFHRHCGTGGDAGPADAHTPPRNLGTVGLQPPWQRVPSPFDLFLNFFSRSIIYIWLLREVHSLGRSGSTSAFSINHKGHCCRAGIC